MRRVDEECLQQVLKIKRDHDDGKGTWKAICEAHGTSYDNYRKNLARYKKRICFQMMTRTPELSRGT